MTKRNAPTNPQWKQLQVYVGFDWGIARHNVAAVRPDGTIQGEFAFPHDAQGWDRLAQWGRALAPDRPETIGVAIETRCGPAVEKLRELGYTVFPLHPKAAQRYRDRKAPSGIKNDALDAWAFGDALRTDGRIWPALQAEDPLTQELRLLCRDEVGLIEQRTALANALRAALHEYYPAALEAFADWTRPYCWAFLQRFPTPAKLVRGGKRAWDKFLHTHRLFRPQTYTRRIEVFRKATDLCGPAAVTLAKSRLALALAQQLRTLQTHIDQYRQRIHERFDQHPQRALFDSLPGAGEILAPRLLGECSGLEHRFEDAQGLQTYAGTAPVHYQSGQMSVTRVRRQCNKRLRYAVHLWANASRPRCAWAQIYYQQKRNQGKSHACALRCLGQRWLKILWRMLREGRPYDEALHTRNQVLHGSWVLQVAS